MPELERHRHELVVCSCDTVIYDCGCRLRLLYVRDEACYACRAGRQDLVDRQRGLCGSAYAEVGLD